MGSGVQGELRASSGRLCLNRSRSLRSWAEIGSFGVRTFLSHEAEGEGNLQADQGDVDLAVLLLQASPRPSLMVSCGSCLFHRPCACSYGRSVLRSSLPSGSLAARIGLIAEIAGGAMETFDHLCLLWSFGYLDAYCACLVRFHPPHLSP